MVLIPHWFVVAPLLLLSAVLLIPWKGKTKNAPITGSESGAVQPLGTERGKVTGDTGGRAGTAGGGCSTALSSLASTKGASAGNWRLLRCSPRLRVVQGMVYQKFRRDRLLRFRPGAAARLFLISGRDGISYNRQPGGLGGSGASYHTRTGRNHEETTLRPRAGVEMFADFESVDSIGIAAVDPEGSRTNCRHSR